MLEYVFVAPFLLLVVVVVAAVFLSDRSGCRPMLNLSNRHVLITGGSKGIGRALAVEAVLRYANVTIVARNEDNLRNTADMLQSIRRVHGQRIHWYSHDLMTNLNTIPELVNKILHEVGPIDILINNVGGAVQAPLFDIPDHEFIDQMQQNYATAACMTKHVLIGMTADADRLKARGARIAFISSQAGQVGLYGYSAYSASKFAMRGFAEAVQMEVRPLNVWLTVAYPPHTDTDGFADEWSRTPALTKRLTSDAGAPPMDPADVARVTMDSVCQGRFDCHFGLDGWMLSTLCAGMSPSSGWWGTLSQAILMGPLRLIALSYLKRFNFIVNKEK